MYSTYNASAKIMNIFEKIKKSYHFPIKKH